jgi:hypothetical protein
VEFSRRKILAYAATFFVVLPQSADVNIKLKANASEK